MIYIIHGENSAASRNTLLGLQHSGKTEFSITDIQPEKLRELVSSFDIFGNAPFIILDVTQANRLNLENYVQVIKSAPAETTTVIFSYKELSTANAFLKAASELKAKIILSKQVNKASAFKFNEFLFDLDKKNAYKEFNNLLEQEEEPFYIFSMILYQLRNIVYIKFDSDEKNKISPFIKQKAIKQANNFAQ